METTPANIEQMQDNAAEVLQKKIRALSNRDLQLWAIGVLVVMVLASGFAALVAPNLMWTHRELKVVGSFLPQLFFGFIALIVLFNVYLLTQRRELNAARQELMSELMFSQRAHSLSLIDPLTQTFNRRYLDHIIPKEIASANRHGTPLSFILVDLEDFRSINARYGHKVGDTLLVETAKLLVKTFSAHDTVLRYGGDEFLVLLPDCGEDHAGQQAERLLGQVSLWNETSGSPCRMALSYGVVSYRSGLDVKDVLQAAELSMERNRKQAIAERARRLNPECLVVSRDREAIEVLKPILESQSVALEVCADMASALDRLCTHRAEAVVVDCDLELEGDFIARVRESAGGRRAVVIALGSTSAPANFTLSKPLSASAVARSLRVAHGLMLAERRRYFRHPVSMPVTLNFGPGHETLATATDLSDGGMAIRCEQPIVVGSQLNTHFLLPGAGAVEAQAEVAWSDGEHRAGLRFLKMSEQGRTALDAWLADHARDAEAALVAQRAARAGASLAQTTS
ncbi:MAG: diguanylate cyclase domain-containing protein [Terriglobales bacterium]